MGTTSRSSKPDEWASKANHTHLIKDQFIQDFIKTCKFPRESSEIEKSDKKLILKLDESIENSIKHILAVDGGYTTVEVKKSFPSSQIAFFQFGAVLFSIEDLEGLSEKPFIFPEDMNKLHNLQRFKLALPIKNLISGNELSLKNSVRKTIYDFFMRDRDSSNFMETLKWLVFEEYKTKPSEIYQLASNPNLEQGEGGTVELQRSQIKEDYTFETSHGSIYLTDVFRLYEAVDEEHGAGGILGYVTRLIEQMIIVHFIKFIHRTQKSLLDEFLFISDGPLSFSGQTANMHKLVRKLCNFLHENHNLFLVGLEKSGPFVDHAQEICLPRQGQVVLNNGHYLIASNRYIYKYIIPGDPERMHYGSTSYYSGKVIFHSSDNQIFVLSVPVSDKNIIKEPHKDLYRNLDEIMINIQKLKCDMYDDSIVPIALANKLVSLANHPSKILLEKFALKSVGNS
jgi:hypothetical protein